MSRLKQGDIVDNPTVKYVKWKSSTQSFQYWDKSANDGEGERVDVTLPLKFIVLDDLVSISGFVKNRGKKDKGAAVYSNQVRADYADPTSAKYIPLVVKRADDGEILAEGLYKDIKDSLPDGCKYTRNIYALVQLENKEWEIWCISLSGAGFAGWRNFTDKKGRKFIYEDGIVCEDFKVEKNAAISYNVPVFKKYQLTPAEDAAVMENAPRLDEYFEYKFTPKKEDAAKEGGDKPKADAADEWAPANAGVEDEPEDELPF
jgi:hypothetical protein